MKEDNTRTMDLLCILALFTAAAWVYRDVRISGLYMDDLYMWSCFGEQSFREFVFPIGSTRCRFVYWLLTWLELGIIKNHISWIVPINILIAGIIGAVIYMVAKKLSKSRIVAMIAGVLYITSRFSYYQVGQLLGLMEAMALLMTIAILFFIYMYMYADGTKRSFYIALVIYFAACFTHERYMVLIPMFLYALIVKRSKDIKQWIATIGSFGLVQIIRCVMIGTVMPAGTGGTYVADTITAMGTVKNCLIQILYMFGINYGPEHLCGVNWTNTSIYIKVIVIAQIVILISIVIITIVVMLASGKQTQIKNHYVSTSLLFIGFIIGCIVAASVTIRVEMRWVYVSYAIALLLLSYWYGVIHDYMKELENRKEPNKNIRIRTFFPMIMILCYAFLALISDHYYRSFDNHIYLFEDQKRYNSLADETYGKYGDDIWGKQIYIVGNSYEMSEFTADTFFKALDKEKTGSGIEVIQVESTRQIGQVTNQMLVIAEDPDTNMYSDITSALRNIRCEIVYGYYRDGWMDQESEIYVESDQNGEITLELMYPGNLLGEEKLTIMIGDDALGYTNRQTFDITENVTQITLHADPLKIQKLHFSYNYIMPDAQEVRGDTPLSTIVTIR